ncbi:helicase-related protein [uncultured Maricaulis sp.]|uniref:helicase-related protein n=1 Tax=uncultured Maricaulis sp. TaxID=174710 RepID=UPI00260EFF56|nr:helicase-related protein [uncultured Maricaulis sp.]
MASHRNDPGQITAALGPTNTGKTHLAVERMLGRASGMIGLPLRLLAREVYDRVVKAKGVGAAALITGEEKIVPPSARYFICTVESMPVEKRVAFVAVDEIQLGADPERGHVFTDRLLRARGYEETMLLGAGTMNRMVRELVPEAEITFRERFSQLAYGGPAKLTRLPRRSAVVAFSAEAVYAIAELLRRRRGGAAVVMGGLSPRTRNAQVELYQSGEVDFLVATDAIGMGLNMDIDHVAFAESRKFDGRRRRRLTAAELAQIAGRAGRFRNDGTFGETADCRPFDPDLVEAVESHSFAPVERLQWRNPDLDDSSLEALQYTLGKPSRDPALERVGEASDERALGVLSSDREIRDRATSPAAVRRLWDACRLPDFRKATLDAHARLIKSIYMHLTGPGSRLPDDWMNGQLERFRKTSGDVDALAARLAHVRTWAYAAHRSDWTRDPEHWRGVTREIEDRLSDALHERLMQRFVDRRTSALVKGLRDERDLLAGVASNGEVTVEGHFVGRLAGLVFKPDADGRELAARTLKSAALRALRPEINRRLGALAKTKMEDLTFSDDGKISWGGEVVAQLIPGPTPLKPAIKLLGGDLGAAEAQSRARAGLEAGLTAHIETQLAPLFKLRDAGQSDDMPGLARGLAWRLYEAGGALPRHTISDDVRNLSQVERRSLRAAGVRIGEHMIYVPELVKPAPARLNALLHAIAAGRTDLAWLPAPGLTSVANDRSRTRAEYAAIGFQPCGPRAVRFDMLERLADTLREAGKDDGPGFPLTADMTALLGCSVEDIRGTLTELGYRRIQKGPDPEKAEGERWDRRHRKHAGPRGGAPRKPASRAAEPVVPSDSPFAALAELALPEQPKRKPRPPRKRRKDKPKVKPDPASVDTGTDAAKASGAKAETPATPEPAKDTKRDEGI